MDHQAALNTHAVERYTLGELTSPEREEFEEHYFTCQECAAALQEHEILAANVRAVFQEDDALASQPAKTEAAAKPSWWSKWLRIPVLGPVVAFALALVIWNPTGGETSAWMLEQARDGAAPAHVISTKTAWLAPSIDLVRGRNPERWAKYHWEVRDPQDNVVAQADGSNGPVQLTLKLKASLFESGKRYKLIVLGDPASGPITSTFVIDRQ